MLQRKNWTLVSIYTWYTNSSCSYLISTQLQLIYIYNVMLLKCLYDDLILAAMKPGVFDKEVVNDTIDEAYDTLYKFIEEVLCYNI